MSKLRPPKCICGLCWTRSPRCPLHSDLALTNATPTPPFPPCVVTEGEIANCFVHPTRIPTRAQTIDAITALLTRAGGRGVTREMLIQEIMDARWPKEGEPFPGQYIVPGALRQDVAMGLADAILTAIAGKGERKDDVGRCGMVDCKHPEELHKEDGCHGAGVGIGERCPCMKFYKKD